MYAVGGQAQNHIACADGAAVDDFIFFHRTDCETGQIVFAVWVHGGHFGGFATDQGAVGLLATLRDAFDHIGGGVDVEFAAGEVVEEKQRFGALYQDVVNAHGDQVNADGVVKAPFKREFEFGADTIRAGDQYRVLVFFGNFKQRTETAQAIEHAFAHGFFGVGFDAFDQRITGVDVYTGIFVG